MPLHRGIVASGVSVLVPSAPATATLSAGTGATTTDTFTWIAPADNGGAITTYGYQISTDNGSSWGTEVVSNVLTYGINTAYTADRYSLRVRAYNSAGWGPYSTNSAQTVRWELNPGTETQGPQTITGTEYSGVQTDTSCPGGACSYTESAACDCGYKDHTQTRTASRTRQRSRSTSSSRYRSRSTNFYSRTGNNNSSTSATGSFNIADAEWNLNTSGTVGYTANPPGAWSITDAEWNLGASGTVGWGTRTYSAWGAFGPYGACDSSGTWNVVDPWGPDQNNFLGDGVNWSTSIGCNYGFTPSNNFWCVYPDSVNIWELSICNLTNGRRAVNLNSCCIPSCC